MFLLFEIEIFFYLWGNQTKRVGVTVESPDSLLKKVPVLLLNFQTEEIVPRFAFLVLLL